MDVLSAAVFFVPIYTFTGFRWLMIVVILLRGLIDVVNKRIDRLSEIVYHHVAFIKQFLLCDICSANLVRSPHGAVHQSLISLTNDLLSLITIPAFTVRT
jgi:hypothetical protein